jgi:hypothetical protein
MVAGVVFASMEGNSAGWSEQGQKLYQVLQAFDKENGGGAGWGRRRFFTMNKVAEFVRQKDPNSQVVSAGLMTFLDAHVTIGKSNDVRLYAPDELGKTGAAGLIHDRPELLIKDLNDAKGPHVWMLEESSLPPTKVPSNWSELARFHAGYARAILFAVGE